MLQLHSFRLRRTLAAVTVLSLGLWMGSALAQEGPLTLIVAFPAGGGVDRAARIYAEKLGPELKRTVVVDNRPGAGGMLAARFVKSAPADGSVLLVTNSHPLTTIPHTTRDVGYDPFTDFQPVANFVNFQDVLVATGEAKSFQEVRAWAKSYGKPVNIGVPAPVSLPEFVARTIGKELGVDSQPIPYRGAAPLVVDLLGGQLELGIVTTTEALAYGPSGKLKIIAVSNRTSMLPGVPSYADIGLKGLEGADFIGVLAPAGMAAATARRYAAAIQRVGAMPDVVAKLRDGGQEVDNAAGSAFGDRMQQISRTTGALIRATGFKAE